MTSKNQVDSIVAERRLRPIYNWLDDGNNRKALQEAEKVLKKQPNFQCAKVLKGLALLRLGKEIECQRLLETVRTDLQCDDSTLQALTICYRELNKPEIICDVYSAATKKDPKNEELLTHLFMAYVRVCDYKKQQQTAMTLYKLKFKNHYYFWTVMSIVMQAHEAGPELAQNLQLPLAEKMVKKFVDDNKIEAEQEVQLYIMILEMQNKLEDALRVVEGPLGEMLHSYVVVPVKRIELLVKMEAWERANVEIRKLLVDDMDNWSLYLDYFKTVFKIVEIGSKETELGDSTDCIVSNCVKFLTDIQTKNQSESHRLRGPYLAIMEFFVRLRGAGIDPEIHFGSITDLIFVYFQNFGSKTSCLNDLKPYLERLTDSQVTALLDAIWKFIELEEGQLPTSKEQMLRYISNLQITRYLGFHEKLTVRAKIQLCGCLLRYYTHGAQFNNPNLLPTDIRHNDPFVILIVEIINDLWLETNDVHYLKNAIFLLENALGVSPSNHQFKLLLIKLYNTLGISKAAIKMFDLLDVKHVQLDSMGYLQCWSLLSTGQYSFASHLYELTLKFFTSNYKDSADHLTFLYKFGSFLKINEFIEFRERLNNSLHYSAVTVEKMLLEIFHSPSYQNSLELFDQMLISPDKESVQFNKLEDNRDLDLCWTSDTKNRQLSHELVKTSFEHDVEFLRMRSLLLRILACSTLVSKKSKESHKNSIINGNNDGNEGVITELPYQTLESLVEEMVCMYSTVMKKDFKRLSKNVMNSPLDSRLFYFLELPYLEFLKSLCHFLISVSKEDLNRVEDLSKRNPVVKLSESISLLNTEFKSSDSTLLDLRCKFLNILTLLLEMCSIAGLFCGACVATAKQHLGHQLKRGKKKKDSTLSGHQDKTDNTAKETILVNAVQNLLSLTKATLQDLDSSVNFLKDKWRENVDSESDISKSMDLLSLEDNGLVELANVQKMISDSYQSSLMEIHNVIAVKLKYLSELHL